MDDTYLADEIAKCCLDCFAKLPKRGKPDISQNEWTVLAGFVAIHPSLEKPVVLSLGTGTKCVPDDEKDDSLLRDQHAEVVCRRALAYRLLQGPGTLERDIALWKEDGTWNVEISVYLYTSKEPCGSSRTHIDGDSKRVKVDVTESLRKPGRGSLSSCRSCSDKITKWISMGLLGATAMGYLSQAHNPSFCGLVVGGAFVNEDKLSQMIAGRTNKTFRVLKTKECFPLDDVCCTDAESAHPSGLSMNWIQGLDVEVTQPNGKKIGANKGKPVNPKHVSRLSPKTMRGFQAFDRGKHFEAYKEKKKDLTFYAF